MAVTGHCCNGETVVEGKVQFQMSTAKERRFTALFIKSAFSALIIGGLLAPGLASAASSSAWVKVTAPLSGATVSGVVTIATTESANVSWINIFVDNVWVASNSPTALPPYSVTWNSATVANGKHSVSVTAYNANNAAIATAANSISVGNCCPLPDAMAAAKVTLNPDFEPRPDNYPADTTVPTAVDLARVGTLGFLNGHGNSLLGKVTGHYTGTTDEILQWASYKWGFDPDITRATAVAESHWHQDDIGDVGNGVSLGILQIKSADYTGTCSPVALNGGNIAFVNDPLCLSHLMTAFAADYKLAYQRACMDGSIGYLNQDTPTAGYPTYASASGDERLWGCVGDWFSGNWYDSGALSYIQEVQGYLSAKTWLQPGF